MQTKEDFEDDGFITEYGRFIDNPRIADIVGSNTGCIMGFTHSFPNSYSRQEEIIWEVQSDSAGNLLPDDWDDQEWWLSDIEYTPDVCVADALTEDEIEEIEGWGIHKVDLESLKNPETRGWLLTLTVEDRASSYDYNYNTYEYKFFKPEDWV